METRGEFGPCPSCGVVMARYLLRCPYCRAAIRATDSGPGPREPAYTAARREQDQEQAAIATAKLDSPGPPPPPVLEPDHYRPVDSLALALRIMFAAWMILGGLVMAAGIVEFRLAERGAANPLTVSWEQLEASDDRSFRLFLVSFVGSLVIAVLFITWTYRSYQNLSAFGVRRKRFGNGWAIGSWFVPFLNLVRPKQIIDDIWHGTDPNLPNPNIGVGRQSGTVARYIHLWWATWIVGRLASSYTLRRSATTYDDYAWRSMVGEVANAIELIGACLAAWMVMRLTARQRDRAASLDWTEPAVPRPRLRLAVTVMMPLAAVATIVFATLAWHEPAAARTIIGDRTGPSMTYDAFDIRFDYPAGYQAAESDGAGNAATEDWGLVTLLRDQGRGTGHLMAVEWMPNWRWGTDDLDFATGSLVDMLAEGVEIPLIRSGTPFELNSRGDLYRARTFSIESSGENLSGAVAAGVCPASGRIVMVRSIYDGAEREDDGYEDLVDLLYSLDC